MIMHVYMSVTHGGKSLFINALVEVEHEETCKV